MASMMYLIYNNDGSIQTLIVPKSIQQGNNGVDKIFVSVVGRSVTGANSYTCSANFTLPDGEITQLVGSVTLNEEVGYKYYDGYTITLTEAQTEQSGKLKMSIYVKDINDNTLYTYRYEFQVNPTPYDPEEALINTALYNSLVQSLNSYLLKVDADKVSGNTIYLKSDIKNQTIADFLETLDQGQDCVVWTRANEVPCLVAVNTDYQSSGNYQLIQREINTNNYKVITGTLSEIGSYGMYNDSHWTTNEFYTKAQTDSALSNKANTNDVYTKEQIDDKGYATETWVVNQEYLVQSDLGGYATETYVATQLQSYDVTIKTWVDNQSYATSGDIASVLNLLNYNVHIEVQQHEFTFSGDTVTFTCSYVNLKTGVTGTRAETIPLANSTTAGLMSYEDYNTLISNTNRISALEGRQFRLTYTASQNPSASDIKSFVTTYLAGIGITSPTDSDYNGVSVVVSGTNHVWNYYANLSTYQDDGVDFVTIFTNSVPGIIQGTNDNTSHTNDGKVYAESNGTGSVLGWDRLTTRVYNLENGGYITVNVTNLVNYYDKSYIDTYIATKTWVQQQGYLTSIPSNVAYKDIDNNFSARQTIIDSSHDTPLRLQGNSATDCAIAFRNSNGSVIGYINAKNDGRLYDIRDNAYHKLAEIDDTLKNAYHLGVADIYSVSNGITTITRKTDYINLSTLTWGWNGDSSWWYCADLIGIVKPTASNSEIPNVKAQLYVANNLNTLTNGEIGVNTSGYLVVRNGSSSTKPSGYLEYETISSYTEQVPTDQPLNTLDQNGSEWLREEWEKTLQLWDEEWAVGGINASGDINTSETDRRTTTFISVKPNTTYYLSCPSSAGNGRVAYYGLGENAILVDTNNGLQANASFTTPSNCYFMRITFGLSYGTTYNHDIMLNKGNHAYPYVPYNKFKGFLKDEYEKTLNLCDAYVREIRSSSVVYVIANNLPSGTYTLSNITTNSNCQLWTAEHNGTNFTNQITFTLTSSSGVEIVVHDTSYTNGKIMLVEGSVALPYEEYNGKIIHEKDLEIFESGENLLNAKGYISSQGISSISGNTISFTLSGNNYNYLWINSMLNGTTVSNILSGTSDTNIQCTFTKTSAFNQIRFIFSGNSYDGLVVYDVSNLENGKIYTITCINDATTNAPKLSNIMLNKGSVALPYKEYVGAIVRESDIGNNVTNKGATLSWTSSTEIASIGTASITAKLPYPKLTLISSTSVSAGQTIYIGNALSYRELLIAIKIDNSDTSAAWASCVVPITAFYTFYNSVAKQLFVNGSTANTSHFVSLYSSARSVDSDYHITNMQLTIQQVTNAYQIVIYGIE